VGLVIKDNEKLLELIAEGAAEETNKNFFLPARVPPAADA